MSHPSATSMRWVRRALTLSRVTMIGGGGLFLDPAGRPCGRRRVISSPSPLPPPSPSDWMRYLPMESGLHHGGDLD
ncbi:hypothetical protein LINPERHAP2_LOCUS35649 [Linum perenne]